jgi:hypothetical protein
MKYSELKLHDNENWIDSLVIAPDHNQAAEFALKVETVERYKTSSLSGNEWRFSYIYRIELQGRQIFSNAVGSLEYAVQCLPGALLQADIDLEPLSRRLGPVRTNFINRNAVVFSEGYLSLTEALLWLPRHSTPIIFESLEGEAVIDKIEETRLIRCSQPGCDREPVSVYRIKQQFDRYGIEEETDPQRPKYRQFCTHHLRRGDCDREDNDANYEVISGPGPDDSVVDQRKVSQSGVVWL